MKARTEAAPTQLQSVLGRLREMVLRGRFPGHAKLEEKQLAEMRARLKEDPGGDWAKLAQLAAEEQAVAKKVDVMMAEWERLSADG